MPAPSYSNDQRQRFLTMMLQKMQMQRMDPGAAMASPDLVQPVAQGPLSQQQQIQMNPMYIEGNPAGPQPLQMPPINVYGNPDPMSAVRPGERGRVLQQQARVPSYEDIAARLRAAGI